MRKQARLDKYEAYVEHPRYGKGPRLTGLFPGWTFWTFLIEWPRLPWWVRREDVVPGTAVRADLDRQPYGAFYRATWYFDVDTACRDCGRRFLFFAEEQRYWYEELGFDQGARAVRCPLCRKQVQHLRRIRKRFDDLVHVEAPTFEELRELGEGCMELVEEGIFHWRQAERVRAVLNRVPEQHRAESWVVALAERVRAVEANRSGEA